MCMTLQALVIFFNIIGPDLVDAEPGRFIVHAEKGDVIWLETDANWCTAAPRTQRIAKS